MNWNSWLGKNNAAKVNLAERFDTLSAEQKAMAVEVYRTELGDRLAPPMDEAGLRAHLETIKSNETQLIAQMEALFKSVGEEKE